MLIIESNALVAIVSSLVSIVVSSIVTWYFARRHYTIVHPRSVASTDVELEALRLRARNDFWGGVGVAMVTVIVVVSILIFTYLIFINSLFST